MQTVTLFNKNVRILKENPDDEPMVIKFNNRNLNRTEDTFSISAFFFFFNYRGKKEVVMGITVYICDK